MSLTILTQRLPTPQHIARVLAMENYRINTRRNHLGADEERKRRRDERASYTGSNGTPVVVPFNSPHPSA